MACFALPCHLQVKGNEEGFMVKESSAGDGDVVRLAYVVELEKLDVIR